MRDRGYIEKELGDKELNLGIRGNYDTFLQKLQIELLLDIREQLAKNNIKFVWENLPTIPEDKFKELTNTPIVDEKYITENNLPNVGLTSIVKGGVNKTATKKTKGKKK